MDSRSRAFVGKSRTLGLDSPFFMDKGMDELVARMFAKPILAVFGSPALVLLLVFWVASLRIR